MEDNEFRDKMIETHNDVKHITKWIEDADRRLKVLEEDRLRIIGGAGALGLVGGFITKWLWK